MIISDATPLIAFARIGQLHLLKEIVGELVIPMTVYRELTGRNVARSLKLISQDPWEF